MANRFLSNIKINDAYTFPASDGTNGQFIATDGAGNLSFQSAGEAGATVIYKDLFTGNASTVVFTLANSVDNEVKTQVYFDGVYQSKENYTVSGSEITFSTAPPSGAAIEVITFATVAAADYNQKLNFYGKAVGAITKGDAVMFAGAQGDHFLITKATQAGLDANHEYFLGLAAHDFVNNQYGYVTQFGRLEAMDTSDYTTGDILWFDSEGSTAGALTTTEPSAPNTKIQIAAVVRVHQNEGVIFVRPTVYHEISELHDISITNAADKDLLSWNAISGVWENTKTLGDITTGNITTSGTVDGVDVSLFKSDYDAHNHDSRYYTELEIDGFLANKNNWDTAYSYSQIGHLPLTGGTLTGSVWAQAGLTAGNNNTLNVNATTSRVGIGAASPVGKLHVESAGSGYGSVWSIADEVVIEGSGDTGMTIQTPNNAKGTIAFADNNTSGAYIQYNHSTDKFSIATGGFVRLTIGETLDMDGVINSTGGNSTNWNTAYGWGDHAAAGYLTSFTETDPVFSASPSAGITSTQITNWNTAYGWGDHSTQSYATQTYVGNAISALVDSAPATLDTLNELAAALGDDPNFATTVSNSIGLKWTQDNTKISNWDTAYGWGNHASAGYITGYTETDTLASVTGRGATTSTAITISGIDSALKVQHDGTSTAWRGRIGSFNSSADKSSFLGNYAGRAGVFGHNNALSAWADLYVNTLGVYGNGNLYLSWNTYVKGDGNDTNYNIWHSGNDGSGSGLDADLWDGNQFSSYLNQSVLTSSSPSFSAVTAGLLAATNTNDASGLSFRSSVEVISGEGWCTAHYAYNNNDGFLFLNRDVVGTARPVFHIGGYNNAGYAGWSDADSMITLVRSDSVKNTGSTYAGRGLSGSSYYSNIVKTTSSTIFKDSQGAHRFIGSLTAGASYNPTGATIGNVQSYGSTSAYVGASDEAGRTAFFGVDSSGYAMFGALTNHDTVLRANNTEYLRVHSSGYTTMVGSARAPIFYDSNDTNYKVDPASTSVLYEISDNLGNTYTSRRHSGSDFPNGTLVQTNIGASSWAGNSFVLEATGKSYSTSPPFSFMAQGYLYADTIINYSGIHFSLPAFGQMKIFEYNGYLCFWWPRWGYWNSFDVCVRNADGSSVNRVTSITDSTEPTGTKKVTVNMAQAVVYDNDWSAGRSLYAATYYDSNNTVYYINPASTSKQYQITNNGTYGGNAINARNHFVQYNSGTTSPAGGWIAAAFGDDSNNRVVIGQWNGNTGAIIGSHTGSLNDWAGLTYVASSHYFHSNAEYTGAASVEIDTGHNLIARSSSRAPIFYDSNNTSYYIDPSAGLSANLVGEVRLNGRDGGVGLTLADGSLLVRNTGDNYHKIWYYDGIAFGTNAAHGRFRFYAESNTQRNSSTGGATLKFEIDSVSGNAWAAGDITAYSDARVKTDIQKIPEALDKVNKLNGVSFLRTDAQEKHKDVRHIGFIAQEVIDIVPEVVIEDDFGMYSVAYGNVTAVLVEAIKELSKKVEELENKLNGNN